MMVMPDQGRFGAYEYLADMAQNASKGAPLPVYWSMAEEKSGDFNDALDNYIETSVYPPQAGENQPTRWDLPEEEEDWWASNDFPFIPEEGTALQDIFDAMEDGDMDQGLDDLEDIVSSTIPTYVANGRLDPPFPVPIEDWWASNDFPFLPEDEPDAIPYDPYLLDEFFAETAGANGSRQPVGGGGGPFMSIGKGLGDVMVGAWDFVRDIGGNTLDFIEDWWASGRGDADFLGMPEEQIEAITSTYSRGGVSDKYTINAALNEAYPDLDKVQKVIDDAELTESDIQDWMDSSRFPGIRNADFLNGIRDLINTQWYGGQQPDATVTDELELLGRDDFPTGSEGDLQYKEYLITAPYDPSLEELGIMDGLPPEAPAYSDQFRRIFNNIPGSQRPEAQARWVDMFYDAEMLFYLSENWSAKPGEGASREWLTGSELEYPIHTLGEEDREKEEQVFATWVQNTYLQNPRQTRFGEEFYDNVRDLRDRMFQIKDLTMEELYDTLTSDWERAPQLVLGDPTFPLEGRGMNRQTPEQAKKTVMDRFIFMDPDSSPRLAQLVGMYNILPGTDHWLKARMMNFYSNMMENWKASGRDSYDFINAFVKDEPSMPGGGDMTDPRDRDWEAAQYAPDLFEEEFYPRVGETEPTDVELRSYAGSASLLPDTSQTKVSAQDPGPDIRDLPLYTPTPSYITPDTYVGFEPIPPGMVRMGGGDIITLDELRRRIKPPKIGAKKWTDEFENILSGLKWEN